MIRVRFAPSPTGYLHIGGVRTALFNFLYARNQKGTFLVRIEDTDRERFQPEFEQEILDSLKWLGLESDEELVRQSQRLNRYKEAATELLHKGLAYEEVKDGKTAIRFKMPEKKAVFGDLVHGSTEFDTSLFDDLVILKSDGYPTYHFACVVDDHDMQVSHVIRGDDHLSNTPRQVLLYEAMGWKAPKYAHLPLILGSDGSPLSKRHGAVSLTHFRKEGYLPEALLNYLAMLGWGMQGNQEFFTIEQLIKNFSLKRVNKSNSQFNLEKLDWLNGQHIKQLDQEEYVRQITESLPELAKKFNPEQWKKLVILYRTRIKRYLDLKVQASYAFEEIENYNTEVVAKFSEQTQVVPNLQSWIKSIESFDNFENDQALEQLTREVADQNQIKAKDLIHPLRFAVSGETVTPGLFELMSVLGKDLCLRRVASFLGVLS